MNSAEASRSRVYFEAMPLAVMLGLGFWLIAEFTPGTPTQVVSASLSAPVPLHVVTATNAAALASVFNAAGYDWPAAEATVPPLAVKRLPKDLAEQPVAEKKSLFFRSLLPLVLAENARIRAERQRLLALLEGGGPSTAGERLWLDALMQRYEVEGDLDDPRVQAVLQRRVDSVPPALALAQAAIESGWGTSRFALEGNNLFGEWTWNADQGLTPRNRGADATHYVRRFDTLRASVASYLDNLNTHPAYRPLRERRQAARRAGREPDAARLAAGLSDYSEGGQAYVDKVRAMLLQNSLQAAVNGASLTPPESRLAETETTGTNVN